MNQSEIIILTSARWRQSRGVMGRLWITVEPHLTAIPFIRPPRYYDHFILLLPKAQSVIFSFNPISPKSDL